jgi:ketosteroid isomerase-like protein
MTTTAFVPENLIEKYFSSIKDLRAGREDAVETLVDLWDEDGVFEFAGSPPVTGTFKGRMAIHTLYKNRAKAVGMPMKIQGSGVAAASAEDAALGVVETHVNRMRTLEHNAEKQSGRAVAGWTTVIGTQDNRGFAVSGSHTFTFKDGRIATLKVVVSPKPDEAPGLSMSALSVDDIGRLALAAWPVV